MTEEELWADINKAMDNMVEVVQGVDDDDDSLLGELADAAMFLALLVQDLDAARKRRSKK